MVGEEVLTYIHSDVPNRRLTDIDTNDVEIIVNDITLHCRKCEMGCHSCV